MFVYLIIFTIFVKVFHLQQHPTSEQAFEYAEQVKIYENQKNDWKIYMQNHKILVNQMNSELELYIREVAGLNLIPEQYRQNVWSRAWCDGHSSGYYEVYIKLCDLVNIFV